LDECCDCSARPRPPRRLSRYQGLGATSLGAISVIVRPDDATDRSSGEGSPGGWALRAANDLVEQLARTSQRLDVFLKAKAERYRRLRGPFGSSLIGLVEPRLQSGLDSPGVKTFDIKFDAAQS
jgi:hypothetical protein